MPTVKDILKGFKNELVLYEKSDKTTENYMTFLNRFIIDNNFKSEKDLLKLEEYLFYNDYINSLKVRGNCNNTINYRLSIISVFCGYLKRGRFIKENIVNDIQRLPEAKKDVTVIDDIQIQLVLDAMKNRITADHKRKIDEINALREYLMVAMMISMGVRVNEVCIMRMEDIDMENEKIGIREKGYKGKVSKILDIPKNLIPVMDVWIAHRDTIEVDYASQDYYFISALTKKNIGRLSIEKRLHQLEDDLGIEKLHPHLLRHSFASNSIHQERLTLQEVSAILGHASLSTTERYYVAQNKVALKKTSSASMHYSI